MQAYDARLYERRWELSEDVTRRRKDRAEWAKKQEEQRRLRTEAFRSQIQREQLTKAKQLETMAKLVNEMVDELNNEIPGWLERKRQIEQVSEANLVCVWVLEKKITEESSTGNEGEAG